MHQENVSYGKVGEVVEYQNSSCESDTNLRSQQLCFIWVAKCLFITGAEITWALKIIFVFQYFLDSNIVSKGKSLKPLSLTPSHIRTSLWSVFHQAWSTICCYSHWPRVEEPLLLKKGGWKLCHLLLLTSSQAPSLSCLICERMIVVMLVLKAPF